MTVISINYSRLHYLMLHAFPERLPQLFIKFLQHTNEVNIRVKGSEAQEGM